ncbi:MAG: hypothetical protein QCI82_08040 [Candidatus Thermoplasmatota archaeon]|nr:hypothetical protein [Candidatus Thermoplasmatota archaeon]
MSVGKFVTAINCMDGRVQLPVNEYMRSEFGADYVDTITDPGPDRILCMCGGGDLEHIKERVGISVQKHGSKVVAVVGHHDCAGYPCSAEEHHRSVLAGCESILSWGLDVRVIGLWLGEDWKVQRIYDSSDR